MLGLHNYWSTKPASLVQEMVSAGNAYKRRMCMTSSKSTTGQGTEEPCFFANCRSPCARLAKPSRCVPCCIGSDPATVPACALSPTSMDGVGLAAHRQQRQQLWQSVDLVHHARAVAGSAHVATTSAAAVLVDRGLPEGPIMIPSSSCSASDRQSSTSGYPDTGGEDWASASGRAHDYGHHRRAPSEWHRRDTGSPPPSTLEEAERGHGGAASSTPIGTNPPLLLPHSKRDPRRRWRSPSSTAAAAEDAALTTQPGHPPSRDERSGGWSDGETKPSRVGRGIGSRWLGGSRWSVAGNRGLGAGAYTDYDQVRETPHDGEVARSSPVRGHCYPDGFQQHQGHQQHHRRRQQHSVFPPVGAATAAPCSGLGGGDPVVYSIALRPLLPVISAPVGPAFPLPRLAEVVGTVETRLAEGRPLFAFDKPHSGPGRCGGDEGGEGAACFSGFAAAAATTSGQREQRR